MAPPPGLLSMTTGWPRLSDSFCPTIRAIRSLPPPGVKPTTIWIARVGYFATSCCACAVVGAKAASPRQALIATFWQKAFISSQPGNLNMEHGGLAVFEHGETALDRRRQLVRFGHAFAMGAERFRHRGKIPSL